MSARSSRPGSELLERCGDSYRATILDVTDTAAVREVFGNAGAEFGRIDVVISNAGYGLFGAAEELSDQQVEDITATNLVGSLQLIRAALPHLRAQGGGRIIQISSYGGRPPSRATRSTTPPSGASRCIAQEVAPFGIGVTIVEPGGARTEFLGGSA